MLRPTDRHDRITRDTLNALKDSSLVRVETRLESGHQLWVLTEKGHKEAKLLLPKNVRISALRKPLFDDEGRPVESDGYDEHAAAVTSTAAVLAGAGYGTPLSWQTESGGKPSAGRRSVRPRSGRRAVRCAPGAARSSPTSAGSTCSGGEGPGATVPAGCAGRAWTSTSPRSKPSVSHGGRRRKPNARRPKRRPRSLAAGSASGAAGSRAACASGRTGHPGGCWLEAAFPVVTGSGGKVDPDRPPPKTVSGLTARANATRTAYTLSHRASAVPPLGAAWPGVCATALP